MAIEFAVAEWKSYPFKWRDIKLLVRGPSDRLGARDDQRAAGFASEQNNVGERRRIFASVRRGRSSIRAN